MRPARATGPRCDRTTPAGPSTPPTARASARIVPPGGGYGEGMRTRTIGNRTVSAIGLGGMPMSIEGRPDRDRSLATIHAALDAGVTRTHTPAPSPLHADEGAHNESLTAGALRPGGGD